MRQAGPAGSSAVPADGNRLRRRLLESAKAQPVEPALFIDPRFGLAVAEESESALILRALSLELAACQRRAVQAQQFAAIRKAAQQGVQVKAELLTHKIGRPFGEAQQQRAGGQPGAADRTQRVRRTLATRLSAPSSSAASATRTVVRRASRPATETMLCRARRPPSAS